MRARTRRAGLQHRRWCQVAVAVMVTKDSSPSGKISNPRSMSRLSIIIPVASV